MPEHAPVAVRPRWRPGHEISAAVVAVSRATLPGTAISTLHERAARVVAWGASHSPTPGQLADLARDAHGLVCTSMDRVDVALLEACPKLVAVGTASRGIDHIDPAALERFGVLACNAPGVVAESTADLTWALILATVRRVVEADRIVRSGGWTTADGFEIVPARDVHGATLGIVGYGAVGRAVARRAQGFGMRVIHSGRGHEAGDGPSQPSALDDLLRHSDIVSLHVPLTDATRGMIGERELRLMRPTAVLINTSRGAVVDEPALVRALEERRIAGAGLDVRLTEPTRMPDPLAAFPNCVLVPHIGTATVATRSRMAELAVTGVLEALEGRVPANAVNPEIGR